MRVVWDTLTEERYTLDIATVATDDGTGEVWPERWTFSIPLQITDSRAGLIVDTVLASLLYADWHISASIWLREARIRRQQHAWDLELIAAAGMVASDRWIERFPAQVDECLLELGDYVQLALKTGTKQTAGKVPPSRSAGRV